MKPRTKSDILDAINITFNSKEPGIFRLSLLCYKNPPAIKIPIDRIPFPARAFILAIAFHNKSYTDIRQAFTSPEPLILYDMIFERMTYEDYRYTFDFIKTIATFDHL